ncbi:MAG: hypothetical protein RH948_08905 [Cyclobacteriaceae bacterium]
MKSPNFNLFLKVTVTIMILMACIQSQAQHERIDSIRSEVKNIGQRMHKQFEDSLKGVIILPQLDSAQISDIAKNKSNQLLQEANTKEYFKEIEETLHDSVAFHLKKQKLTTDISNRFEFQTEIKLDSSSIDKIAESFPGGIGMDSTTQERAKNKIAENIGNEVKNSESVVRLNESGKGGAHDLKEGIAQTQEQLKLLNNKKALKQNMASHSQSYIEDNIDKIQAVQSSISKLKRKYSLLPNSNDLSSAKKRSSLKGEPVLKRLTTGGNINVVGTNPITADLSMVLGWKFNMLSEAGLTGTYRTSFGLNQSNSTPRNKSVYGISTYSSYTIFKNFFGYIEGEYMSITNEHDGVFKRSWNPNLLIGLGRKFNIAQLLKLQTIITYNALHKNNSGIYGSPVVFKTGIRLIQ